ncbi:unnamed protein product [Prunus brigantina]
MNVSNKSYKPSSSSSSSNSKAQETNSSKHTDQRSNSRKPLFYTYCEDTTHLQRCQATQSLQETLNSKLDTIYSTTRPNLFVDGILCVPSFLVNLLSVSKLTSRLNCSIHFFPTFCVLTGPAFEEDDWPRETS